MNFTKRLNMIIIKKDLNEKEFAKVCGVSLYKTKKWLKGLSSPYISDLVKICKALNVRANWLLGLED